MPKAFASNSSWQTLSCHFEHEAAGILRHSDLKGCDHLWLALSHQGHTVCHHAEGRTTDGDDVDQSEEGQKAVSSTSALRSLASFNFARWFRGSRQLKGLPAFLDVQAHDLYVIWPAFCR